MCVCVIEVLMSHKSQSDPPPAGTVMPPTSPLPTLHLALHWEEERNLGIYHHCVCMCDTVGLIP